MILGDLNASCDYITLFDLANNALRNEDFDWWIGDDADTTVHNTFCAYDRIITSTDMSQFIYSPANIYNFPKALNLTRSQSLRISDHYPVEVMVSFPIKAAKQETLWQSKSR